MKNKIVTRFAPSPTGNLHIGSARTALFNYLFTKNLNGKIILRIDDTDQERSKEEFTENIKEGLSWLNLGFDETYRQSERGDIYQKYIEELLQKNLAYVSQEENGEIIRFKNPNKKVQFKDLIRGLITFDTTELGDFVIARDIKSPLYHLASVIDDKEMGITHIIRGEDHIANTPRQILLAEAIGSTPVEFAHIPLILAPDRSKLSKRHGATAVTDYQKMGYLPEAIVNFLTLLGWSPQKKSDHNTQTNEEIFSKKELISLFSLEGIQKSPAIFNQQKLDWINSEHIKKLPDDKKTEYVEMFLADRIKALPGFNKNKLKPLAEALTERISNFKEITDSSLDGELDFFFSKPTVDKKMLKNSEHLPEVLKILKSLSNNEFTKEKIKEVLWDFATEKGRGEVLWPMRVALTGREKSADPFSVAEILGQDETLERLKAVI